MQIYIHRDGQQFGPYPAEQAQDYLASGNLLPGDLAWHEGAADWMSLAQVLENAPVASAPMSQAAWIPPRRDDASAAAVSSKSSTSKSVTSPVKTKSSDATRQRRSSSSGLNDFKRRQRAIGARNMGVGALFCIGGTVVTVFSYEAATTGTGGGTYLVTWGAIIFGGIQFLKGLIQFCKA